MKVRTGFVANSSSSSFLIYGFCIPTGDSFMVDDEFDEAVAKQYIKDKYGIENPDVYYEYENEEMYFGRRISISSMDNLIDSSQKAKEEITASGAKLIFADNVQIY